MWRCEDADSKAQTRHIWQNVRSYIADSGKDGEADERLLRLAVADMVTVAYNTGVIDAKENTNRLADLEKIVIDGYNTPGEFQNWLVDSIRKAYKIGYEERRKEK